MFEKSKYDVGIVGGGLAGLSLSIQLADSGYRVILFEKEEYPFHRVCGEYISMESWDFLQKLGLDLPKMNLPIVKNIRVSAENGIGLTQTLPLGGFGISRYQLDHRLAQLAKQKGVELKENTKVAELIFNNEAFIFKTSAGDFEAIQAAGSFGKRSNLDIKWKRHFTFSDKSKLNNYVGIKYHVKASQPVDTISLDWFQQGYCGLVKVEGDRYNLCYLTTADNLQRSQGDIQKMEEEIVCKNPQLKKIFNEMEKLSDTPVTISQISFNKKEQIWDHMLLIGDAAGMITPLCGNGMSMALHGSKIAFEVMDKFLKNSISRIEMEKEYQSRWRDIFSRRLQTGRMIQNLMSKPGMTTLFIRACKLFPFLFRAIIRRTHGKPF